MGSCKDSRRCMLQERQRERSVSQEEHVIHYTLGIMCILQVGARIFSVPAAVIARVNAKSIALAAVGLCHHGVISPWGILLTGWT